VQQHDQEDTNTNTMDSHQARDMQVVFVLPHDVQQLGQHFESVVQDYHPFLQFQILTDALVQLLQHHQGSLKPLGNAVRQGCISIFTGASMDTDRGDMDMDRGDAVDTCWLSGADQKYSGVSSTVESRFTLDFWMNTLPISCAISFRVRDTCRHHDE
jgi:hypothetical protein